MKKSKYLQLDRIEFMSTYHCPGRCKHCSVADRLNAPGPHHVPVEESAAAIRWLQENYPIQSIMTFGGEPLLYPEVICTLHSTARDCGIPKRQIITNGYFSKRPERIRQVAKELIEAGVNHILLSVDAFHQETIPLEPVLEFARCMQELSPGTLHLSPSWVVNQEHDNEWNTRTREIIAAFKGLGISARYGNDISVAGNAAKYLTEYYPAPKLDLNEGCGSQPYTEPLDQIRSLSIEPNGDVVACAYPIGNLHRQTMAEIAGGYDPHDNPFTSAVLTDGAGGLLQAAEQAGVPVNTAKCYSVCDLCRQIKDWNNKKG